MAERELSILVRAKGAIQAAQQIGKVDSAVGRLGSHAKRGLSNVATNLTRIGLVAGAGVALAVRGGIESLADLEDATTAVDGAIAQMGLTGQLTSGQVASWANQIEADVQAAFDDKAITAAATTLLRFGQVTPKNLQPAMVVMTDLATKTGDVDSAASLMAKALADPTKAAGKLARVGIVLTKAEQDQIKAFVKAGKVGEAQALILDSLAKSTRGAAAASAGPYRDALNTLADVSEDAKRALAEGFLPVIQRVAKWLSTEMAKPETIERIRKFGQGLADGFDKALEFAKNIPWGTIGDAMKTAGAGAKVVFDMFTNLPPWVQTAVISGWGLNKLTGGALGSIVGELGKGLIKGILGINAAVVNINAASVNGGGVPGAAGGGKLGLVGGAAAAGGVGVAAVAGGISVTQIADGFAQGYEAGQKGDLQGVLDAQRGIFDNTILLPPLVRELGQFVTNAQQAEVNAVNAAKTAERTSAERIKSSVDWGRMATARKLDNVTAAIRGIRLAVSVPVTVNVAGRTLYTGTTKTGQTLVRTGVGGQALL